jgi:hypothetical protein
MKRFILLLLFLLPLAAILAQTDSTAYEGKAGIADVADTDPGLFIFMMIFLLGLLVAVVACFACASLLALFIFLLVAAGIVSVSVIMAVYKQSIYTGVKWLVYLSFCIAGVGGVTLICLLLYHWGNTGYTLKTLLAWGMPAGLVGGLLAGWIVLAASKAIYKHFFAKREVQQANGVL